MLISADHDSTHLASSQESYALSTPFSTPPGLGANPPGNRAADAFAAFNTAFLDNSPHGQLARDITAHLTTQLPAMIAREIASYVKTLGTSRIFARRTMS